MGLLVQELATREFSANCCCGLIALKEDNDRKTMLIVKISIKIRLEGPADSLSTWVTFNWPRK
jgi:hypothetical protein